MAFRRPRTVVGVTFEQLGARGPDDHERHGLCPVGEVLEEGEHRLVGPMKVLEHEHGGALLGDRARGTGATR